MKTISETDPRTARIVQHIQIINVTPHINRIQGENPMISLRDAGKKFDKIQHTFMIKSLKKIRHGKNIPQYNKATAYIILNEGKLKLFPHKQEQDKDVHFHYSYSIYCWKS